MNDRIQNHKNACLLVSLGRPSSSLLPVLLFFGVLTSSGDSVVTERFALPDKAGKQGFAGPDVISSAFGRFQTIEGHSPAHPRISAESILALSVVSNAFLVSTAEVAPEPLNPGLGEAFNPNEIKMLRLASKLDPPKVRGMTKDGHWVYEENSDALRLSDDETRELLVKEFEAGGREQRLAVCLFAQHMLGKRLGLEAEQYKKALREWPNDIRDLARQGALAGLTGKEIPPVFSPDFRDLAAGSSRGIDGMRAAKAAQEETRVLLAVAGRQTAKVVEEAYAPALGSDELSPQLFQINRSPFGQTLQIKYTGDKKLTNVLMLASVAQTPGPRPRGEIPNEAIDVFNRAFGSTNEQADNAQRILRASQAHSRMPKQSSGFKLSIEPGQTLEFVIGTMERGVADKNKNTLAVFSDQGRVTSRDIQEYPTLPDQVDPASTKNRPNSSMKGSQTSPKSKTKRR